MGERARVMRFEASCSGCLVGQGIGDTKITFLNRVRDGELSDPTLRPPPPPIAL